MRQFSPAHKWFGAIVIAGAILIFLSNGGRSARAFSAGEPRPAGAVVLADDKGKLRILVDGQSVGTEEFEITHAGANWTARGTTEIRTPSGPPTKVTAQLQMAADGTPLRYEWSTQGQKKASATVEFQGGMAKIALSIGGSQPFLQELSFGSSHVVILDNNLYHHFGILARLYDWAARGAQTFPVLVPQEITPGNITVEAVGTQTVEGTSYETLRVRTSDLEVNLYLDASHKLVRLAAPASKAVVVRE